MENILINLTKQIARTALRSLRRESASNVFWWQGPPDNFGDWIGPYLFEKISGRQPIYRHPSNKSLSTVYLTVGSMARWFCEDSIVWGSGIIDVDENFWQPYKTCAVRGRFTRDRMLQLGYPCPEVYGDPAILTKQFYTPTTNKAYKLGVIPHYKNQKEAVNFFADKKDTTIIDVRTRNIESVIDQIVACEAVISSSLHGVILANTFSVPAAQIVFSELPGGDGIKYIDYFSAFNITPPKPLKIQNNTERATIFDFIKDYPQPTTDKVSASLLHSCPFR